MANYRYVIKLSEKCNLRCSYCYHFATCSVSRGGRQFNVDQIVTLLKKIAQIAKDEATLIWHGGESLLVPIQVFEAAIKTQGELSNLRWINLLQTNATLVNRKWATILKEADVQVGVSIDGLQEIHDKYRIYPNGSGSFSTTVRGTEFLREAGLCPGALVTVTEDSLGLPECIFENLLTLGFTHFDFLPCLSFTEDSLSGSISFVQFAEFLLRVFDAWAEKDDPHVHIRTLEDMLLGIFGGIPSGCRYRGTCWQYMTILPNGDVYPCDKFVGRSEFLFGNVYRSDLHQIMKSENRGRFLAFIEETRSTCGTCSLLNLCRGGCPAQRLFAKDYCQAQFLLFQRLQKHYEPLLEGRF